MSRSACVLRCLSSVIILGASAAARAELGINFPEPATPGARDIYAIHMHTMGIVTAMLVVMFGLVIYALIKFRKSKGAIPSQTFHKSWFGVWSWLLIPIVVLGVDLSIAGNAQRVLESLWVVPKDEGMMEIKVIGHQWYWEFEYLDEDITVESRYVPKKEAGDHYLRAVDNPLVLPTDTPIRFLHTSADVLHAFWIPELGFKKDAIPGYVTETWAVLDREGTFRGQCAELCGTWHARMPLVVEAVSQERFSAWTAERKTALKLAAAEASADKTWGQDELMERGRNAYNKYCSACHQLNGGGLPPTFPALQGSAVATGPVADHLQIVLKGKAGTAMQAWGHLNDLDIAAIVTYERNAWDNNVGDAVQPADVAAAR